MAVWAVVREYSEAAIQVDAAEKPGSWVRMPVLVSWLDDTVNGHNETQIPAGTGISGQSLVRSFPVADLLDADLVRQHVRTMVVELGPNLISLGIGNRNYPVTEDHVIFLPDVKFPTIPEGVPAGVIAVLSDIALIPQGWALCDGTNGTPDLTDVFRPKDHVVYIQKL